MLRSRGINVQRQRIRETLYSIDPHGADRRLRRALHRREYKVEAPNSLWHVDGYHKLIRWRIVVHGGIDGFSRVVVYLKAATNNKASTALSAFKAGVEEYGLPSRVRTDLGGENICIAEYMLAQRGTGRGTIITGRSVHNQRIERLWRDLFPDCVSCFYFLFYSMEAEGILDPNKEIDLYALHFVFLPLLQQQHCLDDYNSPEIRSLNSQVNEQANSGLQHIKGQLSYMKPDNFRFTLSLCFWAL